MVFLSCKVSQGSRDLESSFPMCCLAVSLSMIFASQNGRKYLLVSAVLPSLGEL